MKVQEIMERAGINQTGKTIAYIKDALHEINTICETHVKTERIDITSGQRFYEIPLESIKMIDIRCKHHKNEDSLYRSIPRMVHRPEIVDSDGE